MEPEALVPRAFVAGAKRISYQLIWGSGASGGHSYFPLLTVAIQIRTIAPLPW